MERHIRKSDFQTIRSIVWTFVMLAAAAGGLAAEDWPTYRHDNRRSGVTSESLYTPLEQKWAVKSAIPPQTAWAGPAKWDSYAFIRNIKSTRDFDPAFYATTSGDLVFYGSSVDNAVHCLDAATGKESWLFHTEGPVRLPPSVHDGKVYFGSDDGCAYCLTASDGSLVWKYRATKDERLLIQDGRFISRRPCRTGVTVQDGKAYFAASLLPWDASFLCAVDAATGSDHGPGLYKVQREDLTMQGAIAASRTKLYLSQGRQAPIVFDIRAGESLGLVGNDGDGGIFALLTEDDTLLAGHGQDHGSFGELRGFNAESKDFLVKFPKATSMVVTGSKAYLATPTDISAFDRTRYIALSKQKLGIEAEQKPLREELKKLGKEPSDKGKDIQRKLQEMDSRIAILDADMGRCFIWKRQCGFQHEIILAGQTLFAGGTDVVAALDAADGRILWQTPVEGKAYGLVVSNGRLIVSSDIGAIYCFEPAK